MADDARPPVGSVAEEAARLLDALGGWAATAGYAAGARHTEDVADEGGAQARGDAKATGDASGAPPGTCPSCGAENGVGQSISCQVCPFCQGIALLRSVRPETVDRLADLAGAVAATLRDVAASRREAGQRDDTETGQAPAARRPRVEDIDVSEESGQ